MRRTLSSTAVQSPVAEQQSPLPALYSIFFASGFAGLGFEMVWTHMLGIGLGHEVVAVLAVLAAFFLGLGAGAWVLSGPIARSTRPERWTIGLELLIAAWAVGLVYTIPLFNSWVPVWIGPDPSTLAHWAIAFGSTALLLLPATFAMGATLPAMTRTVQRLTGSPRTVAGLYAANTAGAMAGTLLTTVVLAPRFGFSATLWLCAGINLACAASVAGLCYQRQSGIPASAAQPTAPATRGLPLVSDRRLLLLLAATGLLGLGYEVAIIRVLSQVLEDTVYTFALVLCVYLLGTALGAGGMQRCNPGHRASTASALLLALCGAVAVGSGSLYFAENLYRLIATAGSPGPGTAILGELTVAMLAFALPTVLMGALFSLFAQAASDRGLLGRGVGLNTLAAAGAPPLVGVLLIPAIGAHWTLFALALSYLALGVLLYQQTLRPTGGQVKSLARHGLGWAVAAVLALALAPPLRLVTLAPDQHLLEYRDGVMATVAVVEDASAVRYLKVNNHFAMGSTSSGFADHRQTHLPLLLHPAPKSALILGVGTGMSLNAAQHHPDLAVTAVELLPEALELLPAFGTAPSQNRWSKAPTLLAADARRFVLAERGRFDVIIADLFHPSRDGAGGLYTIEHFRAVRERLTPGGLFVQWLPLFQMDRETLELVMQSFASAFPQMQVHLPHFSIRQPIIGLMGSAQPMRYEPGYLEQRVRDRRLQQQLVALRLNSDFALFGGYLGNQSTLAKTAPGTLRNTDDRPLVTYRAPRFAYEQRTDHGARVAGLAKDWAPYRGTLLGTEASPFAERLNRYWIARDRYLALGSTLDSALAPGALARQTREPLLEIVALSPDFDPAYRPLMRRVEQLTGTDPAAALTLLFAMNQAAPERADARDAIRYIKQRLDHSSSDGEQPAP